ncbi:unnamed protein product [Boreogadus saida]
MPTMCGPVLPPAGWSVIYRTDMFWVREIMKLLISALGKPHLLHTTGTNPVCKATHKVTCSRFANKKALFHPRIRFLLVMEVLDFPNKEIRVYDSLRIYTTIKDEDMALLR